MNGKNSMRNYVTEHLLRTCYAPITLLRTYYAPITHLLRTYYAPVTEVTQVLRSFFFITQVPYGGP